MRCLSFSALVEHVCLGLPLRSKADWQRSTKSNALHTRLHCWHFLLLMTSCCEPSSFVRTRFLFMYIHKIFAALAIYISSWCWQSFPSRNMSENFHTPWRGSLPSSDISRPMLLLPGHSILISLGLERFFSTMYPMRKSFPCEPCATLYHRLIYWSTKRRARLCKYS